MDDESGGPEHRHGEPSIESIQFDADGWTLLPGPPEARRWRDALGNTLQLSAHPGSPDYLEGSADLLSIRAFCRQQADQRGRAIVSVEKTDIAGMDCLSVISKCDGPGYGYHGTITIPADGGCFQFEMAADEHGTSGMREAIVTAHLAASGEINPAALQASASKRTPMPGWFYDPYDASYDGRVLNSIFDDERIDPLFPDHPLTCIRRTLRRIERTVRFKEPVAMTPQRFAIADNTGGVRAASPVAEHVWASLYLKMKPRHEVEKRLPGLLQNLKVNAADPVTFAKQAFILGCSCEQAGQLPAAEVAFRGAREGFESALGEDHPQTALAVTSIARVLIPQGKLDEAELLLRRALRAFGSAGGEDTGAATSLNFLGMVYNLRHRYAEAIPYFERAAALFERARGPNYPDTATALRQLSLSWKGLGDVTRMLEAKERAELIERAPMPRRPN